MRYRIYLGYAISLILTIVLLELTTTTLLHCADATRLMDAGGRAPKAGALGETWSICREGQDEWINSD